MARQYLSSADKILLLVWPRHALVQSLQNHKAGQWFQAQLNAQRVSLIYSMVENDVTRSFMKFQKSDLMTNVKCQVSQIDFCKSSHMMILILVLMCVCLKLSRDNFEHSNNQGD